MRPRLWSVDDLVDALVAPVEPDVAGHLAVVEGADVEPDPARVRAALDRLATLPCVLVAAPGHQPSAVGHQLVDAVLADEGELGAVVDSFGRAPVAAASLALHLRASERRSVEDGLVAESALFSALQAGPEHRAWRDATPVRRRPAGDDATIVSARVDDAPRPAGGVGAPPPDATGTASAPAPVAVEGARVAVERVGAELRITLARPHVRNALDAAMRDELLEALAVAEADPTLTVVVRGAGPSFCSGGDLDEFGTAPDPATAHVVRLRRSIGAVLHRLADRTTVHVHGACAGSGVELAAFAARVVAHPGATFELPELRLGLVPGAGGTVSLSRRIGRHRTALLALTGRPIDVDTARAWHLVDEIALV